MIFVRTVHTSPDKLKARRTRCYMRVHSKGNSSGQKSTLMAIRRWTRAAELVCLRSGDASNSLSTVGVVQHNNLAISDAFAARPFCCLACSLAAVVAWSTCGRKRPEQIRKLAHASAVSAQDWWLKCVVTSINAKVQC